MKNISRILISISMLGVTTFCVASGGHGGGHDMKGMNMEKKISKEIEESNASPHEHAAGNDHEEKSPVGYPSDNSAVDKEISVVLSDAMRIEFSSPLRNIQSGTTIKFTIKNEGRIPHEFSIADEAGQQAHLAMMRSMPNMVHNDGNTVTVAPGKTAVLVWKFEGETLVVFSCNIPGHFEAGMFQKIPLRD
jgi:uncharacterized cupredoxin-like copper-binding protein